ncbi:hypothetical protein JOD57_004900 [Geodermatophilus bullaregiensis]|uniref:hypothetical protein n=1 Tax=Geodermatophilus bullaregiensis TaxID=1564160 RepID=UPI00195BBD38|nr:hypothetical protein [Geodermatophilus bullaregiensis]MBM7809063.1 hypothetical protein [Geodermatophilus bullaregiensis]
MASAPQPVQDPSTPGGTPPHGSFFTTLPGVLTALAGLITAVTGAVGIYLSQGDGSSTGGSPPSALPSTTEGAGPVPEGSGQADPDDLPNGFEEDSMNEEASTLIDDCEGGDAGACTALLDLLAVECAEGYGASCDALWYVSPPGSAYEDYGATCGGRYDWTYVGVCSQL